MSKNKIQADLDQEKLLIQEMKIIKKKIKGDCMMIERLKGLLLPEDDTDDNDYRLISNFSEIKLKSCKNSHKRLKEEDLGFLVYGKNVTFESFKQLMNAFRSQLRSLYPLRTPESVTPAEKKMLEEKYFGEKLPLHYFHDGYSYIDGDGNRQFEHPNLKKLIEAFLEDENAKIADYNRKVHKEWKQDSERYS